MLDPDYRDWSQQRITDEVSARRDRPTKLRREQEWFDNADPRIPRTDYDRILEDIRQTKEELSLLSGLLK